MAAAPVLQQFFPQATRHSLLGPPPVGVSLKPARLAFPALPFQRQNRTFRKVSCAAVAKNLAALFQFSPPSPIQYPEIREGRVGLKMWERELWPS